MATGTSRSRQDHRGRRELGHNGAVTNSPRTHRTLRWAADIVVTLGLIAIAFAVYLVFWTNTTADRAAAATAARLEATLDRSEPVVVEKGQPFGLIYIPRLRQDVWGTPILQGVGARELARGFGHYPQTPLPGEPGNSGLAAHRATHGEPLRFVDRLQRGDRVYIRMPEAWYTYRLVRDEIVSPRDVGVIGPDIPDDLGVESVLTLTTCHPRWGSTQRWVWWAVLESTDGQAPALV